MAAGLDHDHGGLFERSRAIVKRWTDKGGLGFVRSAAACQSFDEFLRASQVMPSETLVALLILAGRADEHFGDIASYVDLPAYKKMRLLKLLLRAKRRYDLLESYTKIPRGSGAKPLQRLAQGMSKITAFADALRKADLQAVKAFQLLEDAGERWADEQPKACKPGGLPIGFPLPLPIEGVSYGAAAFIENFLESARIMGGWIAEAQLPLPKRQEWPATIESSPTRWLCGEKLPQIYERVFRREFKATIWEGKASRASEGALFAQAAIAALGMEPVTLENISAHWHNAQKKAP
ncbi:hypothetical protein [Bradyrhizobium erythrophlei]|uniref:Uncharacterized protein n=1 Tax=Bradyrhizobium erythrophlei TaxID=1437360 RepID=A0A1M5UFS9_9BRAD|nr:hypothetical protein [Bradyrhizobium erythrophlei]SHH61905.1 hypothetical protein SAMN05443248_5426 [Bradyrhizobium erythrophlei]